MSRSSVAFRPVPYPESTVLFKQTKKKCESFANKTSWASCAAREETYSHFELKNITFRESKLTMLF